MQGAQSATQTGVDKRKGPLDASLLAAPSVTLYRAPSRVDAEVRHRILEHSPNEILWQAACTDARRARTRGTRRPGQLVQSGLPECGAPRRQGRLPLRPLQGFAPARVRSLSRARSGVGSGRGCGAGAPCAQTAATAPSYGIPARLGHVCPRWRCGHPFGEGWHTLAGQPARARAGPLRDWTAARRLALSTRGPCDPEAGHSRRLSCPHCGCCSPFARHGGFRSGGEQAGVERNWPPTRQLASSNAPWPPSSAPF